MIKTFYAVKVKGTDDQFLAIEDRDESYVFRSKSISECAPMLFTTRDDALHQILYTSVYIRFRRVEIPSDETRADDELVSVADLTNINLEVVPVKVNF